MPSVFGGPNKYIRRSGEIRRLAANVVPLGSTDRCLSMNAEAAIRNGAKR
jgi:hypothetical protein